MLGVTLKSVMLSAIMLGITIAIMLGVVMLGVKIKPILLSVIMLAVTVIMLSVIVSLCWASQ